MKQALAVAVAMLLFVPTHAIQCYSGSQLQILECPSVSCIKQSLGLDTVRYCDGTGASSICQAYRIFDSCQNIPNLGYICCCSESLCNDSTQTTTAVSTLIVAVLGSATVARWLLL